MQLVQKQPKCVNQGTTFAMVRWPALTLCTLLVGATVREQRPLNVTSREELELQAAQRKEKNLAASIQRLKATLAAKEVALRDTSDTTALLTSRIQSARDPEAADRAKVRQRSPEGLCGCGPDLWLRWRGSWSEVTLTALMPVGGPCTAMRGMRASRTACHCGKCS